MPHQPVTHEEAIAHYKSNIEWDKTSSMEFPFVHKPEEDIILKIRVNDFPPQALYTLLKNEKPLFNFNNWPPQWKMHKPTDTF